MEGGSDGVGAEFRVLGELRAEVDGRDVDLGPRRQRCVLAVLLVEAGRPVSADELVDRVWGDQPPQRARDTLYSYLSRLRGALGTPINHANGGYRLDIDPEAVDLHRFRRLVAEARSGDHGLYRQALELWPGEALTGISTPWLDDVREQLAHERFAAWLDHVDGELRAGRHADVLADIKTEAARRPEDERLAGQLMLALYRSGRQADALRHYDVTRRRLAEELGTDPSPPLQAVYQQILATDGRASAPVPRQLPAPPPWFTGRQGELEALDFVPTDGAVPVAVIAGTAGIGKTALALHWSHRRLDRFPDGQLFVNLHGFAPGGESVPPAAALGGLLDGLGVPPGARPVDLDAQIGLYRSLVAGRRMLILLDNAVDSAQVAPLLPGSPTCAVLVTSRDRLSGLANSAGARQVPVTILSDVDAKSLLTARLGAQRIAAEPDAATEIVAYCGGSPLALGIVGARAAAYPDFGLGELAAELRDAATRLDALDDDAMASLPAALSWSYNALKPEQAELFALLGLAPGPDIGLPAVAALADLPPATASAVLRALERVSLVQQDKPGRYRMHDLVRLYAREQPADREAALKRLTDHYIRTAYAGDRLLYPSRAPIELGPETPGSRPQQLRDVAAALAWFDAEHPCLMATLHLAEERERWQLAWATDSYLHHRGRLRDALDAWTAALGDIEPILTLRRLGNACSRLGRHDEALDHLQRALAMAKLDADQAHCHRSLSFEWGVRGENHEALEHAVQSLRYYEKLDNPVLVANAHNQIGWYAAQTGDFAMALSHCEAALAMVAEHPDPQVEADTLDSMGFICHRSGDHEQALVYYRRALARWRKVGAVALEADVLEHIGDLYADLGDHARARDTWAQVLEHYRAQHRLTDAARVESRL
ncbi:BTAD domain-containing putative transcriptional regulator [Kutzneria buriramensis]|uniref:DNA-binding SARP family transcriptional activator n=1 Tax=Kutzneria buriramensis TaxID=1045776 RepID=A0A3E0H4I0_9PSEU|nr:BTAD domain-containing putative transcriptional regulator [Kutzneria buriramensis]REH37265.1 DNA-binding SARP family transcriptional activator [Kutzneria buriramensis]